MNLDHGVDRWYPLCLDATSCLVVAVEKVFRRMNHVYPYAEIVEGCWNDLQGDVMVVHHERTDVYSLVVTQGYSPLFEPMLCLLLVV